tara:strand:- start:20003 stop:22141 length:2139 start_codon:yes stop_codon:yes gene_type:complete
MKYKHHLLIFFMSLIMPALSASTDHPFLDDNFHIRWDLLAPEHIQPDIEKALTQTEEALLAIEVQDLSTVSYDSTLLALEEAIEPLEAAWGKVSHLENVNNVPELREPYNQMLPTVSAFFTNIPLREDLWKVIKAFSQTEEAKSLTGTRKRFLEETVADFEKQGADLPEDKKEELARLNAELAKVTQKYSENVLDSTNAWELIITDPKRLEGLPQSAKDAAQQSAAEKGHGTKENPAWRFTLHYPSYSPVMQYGEDESLRKEIWEARNTIGTAEPYNNTENVLEILKLRQQIATLLGKKDFADYVLSRRMAKNGETALNFTEDLHDRVKEAFNKEVAELEAYKAEKTGEPVGHIEPWSRGYWIEKRRQELYSFNEEELRPYFPMKGVKHGLFELVERLYGVQVVKRKQSVKPAEGEVPVWHEDVRFYDVLDKNGTHLGSFYADWHPRPEKRGGAWMVPLTTGNRADGKQEPHSGIIAGNLTPPIGDEPALLNHREVETIFHEFGHLLHHLLGNVEVKSLNGTSVAWDFVEMPSQVMENWCWERESLDLFARHYETGEPIPEDLFQKLVATRTYGQALFTMRQLSFGKMDLDLHIKYDPAQDKDLEAYIQTRLEDYSVPTPTKEPSHIRAFTHVFGSPTGYAAGYYSYKWAEVLDADAFTRFKTEGLMSPQVGGEFRDKILSKGNSEDPAKLFRDFMGREPDPDALLRRAGLL